MIRNLIVILIAFCAVAFGELAPPQKGTLVTVSGTFEIKAPPEKVWKTISSVAGFCALTGFKPDTGQNTLAFTKIGDHVSAQIWGDKGHLIATVVEQKKELRVTWDPSGGHYLCAKRIVLKPSGQGTTVEYWDRYSDDQPAAKVDETLKQVTAETKTAIETFRTLAEKP